LISIEKQPKAGTLNLASLPVMEQFLTLQGEGVHTGRAAYFIRLAGCDVGCHWCDVKESWAAENHSYLSIPEMVKPAAQSGAPIAVITGGEPTQYDLTALCTELKNARLKVHLETSGAYPIKGIFDWICLSPKKNAPPLKENIRLADELKVIIYNNDDFRWAEEYAGQVSFNCRLLLQPEWSKREKMRPDIIKYILDNPKWQISIQTHKYLGIP
jgi:organic radical activating enzyme